ncbi:MAG: mannose-1-phosphate guanyltransferase [Planctomycetaceae bacterium]|nr:mannose-1-phosphate guanyltransferase [Planctomycetaceae bacterium]
MLHLVIMAGGSATRTWPESRRARPKQFLSLVGSRSMLQQAVERCRPWIAFEQMHVVTNAQHADQVRRQVPELPAVNVLLEPCGRNTAACIGLAALCVSRVDPDAVLLVTPADHLIRPNSEFRASVEHGVALLQRHPQSSILFGIRPTYAATGYGYIERVAGAAEEIAFPVKSFREKPTRAAAEAFLQQGDYFWNVGIFLWRAACILDLLREFQPEIHARLMRLAAAFKTSGWNEALQAEFPGMPSISIDHGVMEPLAARRDEAHPVFVIPASFEWDDIGSFQSLQRVLGSDAEHNTVVGPHCGIDTSGCVIRTTPDHLVATIGIENLVVVHTPDATLIAPKDDEIALRKLVTLLEEKGYERFL